VDRVWSLSEGNPFVIVETMRALRAGRLLDAGVGLPRRVREVIAARLARLGPGAQELARLASAFTREIEFPVLQRAAGLSRRETAEAVEELVRRRVLDAVGERFDFTHVRLRQAIHQALLAPRRQALHAAIGEALEAVYAGRLEDVLDRLVHHFSQADEPGRAVRYLIHLADKVARGYALEEAVRLLHDGLAATERLPAEDQTRPRLDIVYRLAHVLAMLGRPAEARDLLLRHEGLVGRLGQPALSGAYHFWLAHTYGNLGDGSSAIAHARRALEDAARGGDDVIMGMASQALAREQYIMGRPREAIAHGRQAVALLERSQERWWLGEALRTLALNLLHLGDFAPALEIEQRIRAVGESTGDVRLQAYAAWTAGRVHTVMGDGEAAIAACRRSVELAADPVAQANAVGWLGAAHLENGDAGGAAAHLEDAVARLQHLRGTGGGYRDRQLDGILRAVLGEAQLSAGDVALARASVEEALAITRAGGWPVAVGYAERAMGRVALAQGRLEEAGAALERALLTFAASEARAQVARTRVVLAELRAARGERDAAAAELRAARALFEQLQAPCLVDAAGRLAAALGVSLEATMLTFHGSLPDVAGQTCEALLVQSHYYRGQLVDDANVLFLQLARGRWHRIFIEAGVVFWQTVDGLDSPDQDRHHYTLADLGARHGVTGQRLVGVTTADLPSGGELRLTFTGDIRIGVRHVDCRSEVVVEGGVRGA
jgi:tetratricopeptide (TPR) repeat protein